MENYPLANVVAKPPKAMGKAKLVFLEPRVSVVTPKIEPAWTIRPVTDDAADDKFSLECRLDSTDAPSDSFKTALTAFDMKVRSLAFGNKKAWFGKVGDDIMTESDLRTMHSVSVKKGSEKLDGSRYDDTVKFKVNGWQAYVDEVIYKSNSDNKWPVDVKWRTRLVDAQGRGGPDDNQTRFYICQDTSMTTGKEQMVPWTPCQDPAGNHIKDASGNTVYEFVGPKHCQPGCKVRVVFNPSMVWLAAKFGVTLAAKQVFITPAPAKAKSTIDGIEIKDYVDPILAGRAARAAMSTDVDIEDAPDNVDAESVDAKADKADKADAKADKPDAKPDAKPEKPDAKPDVADAEPKKKKAEKPAEDSPLKKKSKTEKVAKTIDEEF
jgi:hypothetical protein